MDLKYKADDFVIIGFIVFYGNDFPVETERAPFSTKSATPIV